MSPWHEYLRSSVGKEEKGTVARVEAASPPALPGGVIMCICQGLSASPGWMDVSWIGPRMLCVCQASSVHT